MRTFEMEVTHDQGKIVIRIKAHNIDAAMQSIMESENCPRSAIGYWRVVPTKKQVDKTKRIMAGM